VDDATPVRFRIAKGEELLRRTVLLAGGRWDDETNTWMLPRNAAASLGLTSRLRRK